MCASFPFWKYQYQVVLNYSLNLTKYKYKFKVAYANIKEENWILEKHNISEVPGIFIYFYGNMYPYYATRTGDGIGEWMHERSNLTVKKLKFKSQLNEFTRTPFVSVLYLPNNKTELRLFKKLHFLFEELTLGYSLSPNFKSPNGTMKVFRKYGDQEANCSIPENLTNPLKFDLMVKCLRANFFEKIIPFSRSEYFKIVSHGFNYLLLAANKTADMARMEKVVSEIYPWIQGRIYVLKGFTNDSIITSLSEREENRFRKRTYPCV